MAGIDPSKCKVSFNKALDALEKADWKQNLSPGIKTIGPQKMFKLQGVQTPFRLVTWDGGEKQMLSETTIAELVYGTTALAAGVLADSLLAYNPLGITAARSKTAGVPRRTNARDSKRQPQAEHGA